MMMRGVDFGEPVTLDSKLPSEPGIYIVFTEKSGGILPIGVYGDSDMNESMLSNKWRKEWEKHVGDAPLMVYYAVIDKGKSWIDAKCQDIIDTRPYELPCVDRLTDGW